MSPLSAVCAVKAAGGEGIVILIIFIGKNRLPRRYGADQRNINAGIFFEADRPVFVGGFVEKPAIRQFFDIIVGGGGRFDVEFGANLAYSGGVAVFRIVLIDKVQHRLHFIFAAFRHTVHLHVMTIIP